MHAGAACLLNHQLFRSLSKHGATRQDFGGGGAGLVVSPFASSVGSLGPKSSAGGRASLRPDRANSIVPGKPGAGAPALAARDSIGRGTSLDSAYSLAETQELLRRRMSADQMQGLELGALVGRGSFGSVFQGAAPLGRLNRLCRQSRLLGRAGS